MRARQTKAVTQELTPAPPEQVTPSRYFFIRRRPKRGIPREWVRPLDEQYAEDMVREGFIAGPLFTEGISDALKVDCRELEENLLPHFWRMDQLAKFYQNRHYVYQWSFILTAFLTTALAVVSVFIRAKGWGIGLVGPVTLVNLLGLMTAISSGVAAVASFLDANVTPQKRWYKARAQAETLRSLYFLFLARQAPFDVINDGDRVQRLRERALNVLIDTDQKGKTQ